jgi:hypothetical protein
LSRWSARWSIVGGWMLASSARAVVLDSACPCDRTHMFFDDAKTTGAEVVFGVRDGRPTPLDAMDCP